MFTICVSRFQHYHLSLGHLNYQHGGCCFQQREKEEEEEEMREGERKACC